MESTTWFQFSDADAYAFWYEDAHLVLMRFQRDEEKMLFVLREQTEVGAKLTYPGRLFQDRVLDEIGDVFFISLEESDGNSTPLALGAYFRDKQSAYGAYYPLTGSTLEVCFFQIDNENEASKLGSLSDEAYQRVAELFAHRYGSLLDLHGM
ncbi:hypothetical protein [Alicyclobacillus herbarius]|uniref:hypothetical protein n=1 Tax=Alicyclobacillus herbarius TaxID=122960 RepID=UPI0004099CF3|nr:hypothetical protein [Alicyclobacillus herbarius]